MPLKNSTKKLTFLRSAIEDLLGLERNRLPSRTNVCMAGGGGGLPLPTEILGP